MFHTIFEKAKTAIEGMDLVADVLVLLGLARHSKRRDKNVPNEKVLPRLAIEDWHRHQYNRLVERRSGDANLVDPVKDITPHERRVLDHWFQSLHELQQDHFKVAIANLSFGNDEAEANKNAQVAINFLKEMAALSTNNERTALADARDYIKDPAKEYLLYRAEKFLGKRFKDLNDFKKWLKDTSPNGFLAFVDNADDKIFGALAPELARLRTHLGVSPKQVVTGSVVNGPSKNGWFSWLSLEERARRFK